MIQIENVSKVYETKKSKVTAVDNVSISIDKGEIFGIVGYSGAGKSTLVRCINLLERPTSGEIKVNGVNLMELDNEALRQERLKMGMIFQHFNLVSQKTVFDNIAFSLKAAKTPKEKISKRIDELLEMVSLSDKKHAYPDQLSGGQKQRVGIARALANNPNVLLCDEATSALDPTTTNSILRLLKRINKELGITIILITHEMNVVKEICDRMAIMENGKVMEQGDVYDIFSAPKEELTKEFIENVVSFTLPDATKDLVKGTLVKVLFKGEVAGEGLITETVQAFKIKGNFLHGSIEYIQEKPLGIFIMELNGDKAEIDQALQYIEKKGAEVEVIDHGV
jgi:D-methionine transport system ATP-binding protein